MPFGMNTRQQNAWMYHGGGLELMREFYKDYNIYQPAGRQHRRADGRLLPQGDQDHRGPEGPQDAHRRLRRRRCCQKLGVVPQQIAGGDIYPALEKGTIDAAEWVGPYDDEKLGFDKVAKLLLLPRLVGGRSRARPVRQHEGVRATCRRTTRRRSSRRATRRNMDMIAKYDALNPAALRRLVASGVQLRPFPREIMEACYRAANEVFEETVGDEREVQEGLRAVEARSATSRSSGSASPSRTSTTSWRRPASRPPAPRRRSRSLPPSRREAPPARGASLLGAPGARADGRRLADG